MFYSLYLADDQTKLVRLDAEFAASNKDLFIVAPDSVNPTEVPEVHVTETASVEKVSV